MGLNGYGLCRMRKIAASRNEKIVFTRNSAAERSMLFIQRRPSATASGSVENSEFIKTSCETLRAASLPS